MNSSFSIVHYLTQTEVNAGVGTNLSGGQIEVIDAISRQPTGIVYTTGAAGSPVTQAVTASNINTVLAAAGGAGWEKVQVTTANYALTKSTTGASRDFHIETNGTLIALSTANWAIPSNGIDQLKIRNFSGIAQTFTVTTGNGQFAGLALTVPEDSISNDNSYTIPAATESYTPTLLVTIDNGGWVQAQLIGSEVSQAELTTLLAPKADSAIIEKSLLWNPSNLSSAIDLDFESLPLGAVTAIVNTGTLGGTADNATASQRPIIVFDTETGRKGADFDGTDDWLESSANWTLGTTYGLFAVARLNTKVAASMLIGEVYETNIAYALEMVSTGIRPSHYNGGWKTGSIATYTDGDLVVFIGNFDGTNFNSRMFGVDSLSAQTTLAPTPANGRTRIGRRWDSTISTGNMADMTLFRVIGKAGAFTVSEINSLEAWAVRHFGLEAKITRPVSTHTHAAATTTANGLMLSTDKAKLDGIATGAEVNIQADWSQATTTADDFIKNKPTIAALEGTTTPVMDGTAVVGTATTASRSNHVHPTDTSRASTASLTDGSVNAYFDRLRWDGATAISGTNLNSLTVSGFYDGQTLTNAPNGATGWFYIIHQRHSNLADVSWHHQTAYGLGSGTGSVAGEVYVRNDVSGTWSAWTRVDNAALPALSSTTPAMDGTGAVGTGTTTARADHVHPTDTSRAALAGPTFTGTIQLDGSPVLGDGTNHAQRTFSDLTGATMLMTNTTGTGASTIDTSDIAARFVKPGTASTKSNATMDIVVGSHTAGINANTQVDFRLGNAGVNTPDVTVLSLKSNGDVLANGSKVVREAVVKTVGGASIIGSGDIPFPTFATSLRLMTPTDIIEDTDRAIYLLADDLALGAVATWANPGTGGDFTQATTTSQPTVEAVAALGGRRAALFADDFMEAANISLGTAYGLFAVFIPANVTTNQYILTEVFGGSTVEYTFGIQTNFFVGHYNGAWRQHTVGTPVANTPYIIVAGYDGANMTIKIDGGTASTVAQTSNPILTEAGNIRLGRRWDGTADIFDGHIACVVAKRNSYFTAAELAQLEGWAAWYYGRVSVLPAGHTYKTVPPMITA